MAGMSSHSAPTGGNRRQGDATFDLNLAPFLDIVVSVIPLLLLSVVFVEIRALEAPVPAVVSEAIKETDKNNEVQITLSVSRGKGFEYSISDKGKMKKMSVPLKDGKMDFVALKSQAEEIKGIYPQVFKLSLSPSSEVSFKEVAETMDTVRKLNPLSPKISFTDPKTQQRLETDLLFPNVTFANVTED